MFYKIEESVGQYYIVHDGVYLHFENAEKEARKYPNTRVVLCDECGPIKVEEHGRRNLDHENTVHDL